jgi:catechol 2,3-dioxygenase-like lactoylglutathione lyase family enzyme
VTLLNARPVNEPGSSNQSLEPEAPTGPLPTARPGTARERSFIGHSAIAVAEIDRSIAFYAALGFEPLWRDPDWAFLRSPVGWGVALLGPSYRGAGPHLGFHLGDGENLKDWRGRCQAAGARGLGQIHRHRDGSSSFYASDPDGNTLEWVLEPGEGLLAAIKTSSQQAHSPGNQDNIDIKNNKELH